MDNQENIKDVDYEEVKTQKTIRGKAFYYSTSQVANILGETDSKIRYYSTVFDEILRIEVSNKQRQYTDDDIEKLKFIIELKNSGMTLKQIKEYCAEVDFSEDKPVVKESNPLTIQALAKALMEEQNKQLSKMKDELKTEIVERLETYLDQKRQFEIDGFEVFKSDLEKRVNNTISEKLNVAVDEIKQTIDVKFVSRDEIENYSKKKKGILNFIFNR